MYIEKVHSFHYCCGGKCVYGKVSPCRSRSSSSFCFPFCHREPTRKPLPTRATVRLNYRSIIKRISLLGLRWPLTTTLYLIRCYLTLWSLFLFSLTCLNQLYDSTAWLFPVKIDGICSTFSGRKNSILFIFYHQTAAFHFEFCVPPVWFSF